MLTNSLSACSTLHGSIVQYCCVIRPHYTSRPPADGFLLHLAKWLCHQSGRALMPFRRLIKAHLNYETQLPHNLSPPTSPTQSPDL